jgi:two-component system, chemotaxis family, chemotaxis protein CheY
MKTLIVEDDCTSQLLLRELLRGYGPCHVTVNGREAVAAVEASLRIEVPYHLICLDVMMPEMDGQEALREIRALEHRHGLDVGRGARILMTSALRDKDNVMRAFSEQCDGYMAKPIDKTKLISFLRQAGLVEPPESDG